MKFDEHFSNLHINRNGHWKDVRVLNSLKYYQLAHNPITFNTGYFLSEEKNRRLITDGFELYISEDGNMVTLHTIRNGELMHLVASDIVRHRHVSNFASSQHVAFFNTVNVANYWFVHHSPNDIRLYFSTNEGLRQVRLYKKQIRNVVFDSNLTIQF